MPEASAFSDPSVYQVRVVLRGVGPLIWRGLLVRNDTTVAELHAALQLVLGWTDEHLNRFITHDREYGVSHSGGIGFRDDPRRVRLVDLGLRIGERFLYEYNFTDGWQRDVRGERILPLDPRRRLPGVDWHAARHAAGLWWAVGVPGAAPVLDHKHRRSSAGVGRAAHCDRVRGIRS